MDENDMPIDILGQMQIYGGRCLYMLVYGFSFFTTRFITS